MKRIVWSVFAVAALACAVNSWAIVYPVLVGGGSGDYAPALGDDDNYVSDSEKSFLGTWEKEFTVVDPDGLPNNATRGVAALIGPKNTVGSQVTITEIQAWSDTDNYAFVLYVSGGEYDFGTTNDSQIDSVSCSSDGTGCFYSEITEGFDGPSIADGRSIIFDHSSGDAGWVKVRIKGTF